MSEILKGSFLTDKKGRKMEIVDAEARAKAEENAEKIGQLSEGNVPSTDQPFMQLVTDAEGEKVWEKKEFFESAPQDVSIFPETTFAVSDLETSGASWYKRISLSEELVIGKEYRVIINGETYKTVCKEGPDYYYWYLGDPDLHDKWAKGDSAEPFCIYCASDLEYHLYFYNDGSGVQAYTIDVLVSKTIVTPLPEKYVPYKPGLIVEGKKYIIDDVEDIARKGAEIFNDYDNNVAIGEYSHAEGHQTFAGDIGSHAEGSACKATASGSHAEGSGTTASGYSSHAEGDACKATGSYSHAEGQTTIASGKAAHSEGRVTIAAGEYQHVQGKFNLEDTANKYAHIVGNGTSNTKRSNAHTLDWDGNAWFAGTMEGTGVIVKSSTEGSTKRFKITVDDSGTLTATEVTD